MGGLDNCRSGETRSPSTNHYSLFTKRYRGIIFDACDNERLQSLAPCQHTKHLLLCGTAPLYGLFCPLNLLGRPNGFCLHISSYQTGPYIFTPFIDIYFIASFISSEKYFLVLLLAFPIYSYVFNDSPVHITYIPITSLLVVLIVFLSLSTYPRSNWWYQFPSPGRIVFMPLLYVEFLTFASNEVIYVQCLITPSRRGADRSMRTSMADLQNMIPTAKK